VTVRPRTGVIDYGSGNLRSVAKALEAVGAESQLILEGSIPDSIDALVLPGVGSFGDSVRHLQERGLFQPVREWLVSGRAFLGICLGYQLLFRESEESPGVEGLALFNGVVRRFHSRTVKVPHIGWNRLTWTDTALTRFPGLPPDPHVYFVHSYYPVPESQSIVAAKAAYGEEFAAAIITESVFATQFHPEKSQENGLAILRQFVSSLA
jgi:imidazole glycerol-phosphate synthase subunit HisH